MGKHIFVTGVPGIGKSTLIHRVLDQLNLAGPLAVSTQQQAAMATAQSCGAATGHTTTAAAAPVAVGFYTEEVRVGGERQGFDIITLDGKRGPLARMGTARRGAPAVGKYVVDVASFEALALLSIQPSHHSTKLVVIDEVGKMELLSASFYPAVQQALDTPQVVVLGSVPVPRYGRSIPQVEALKSRPDVTVITVTRDNRDQLVASISQKLQQMLFQLEKNSN